jgi:hypothetical protein
MIAAGRDLGAARGGVPRLVGPLDGGAHGSMAIDRVGSGYGNRAAAPGSVV